MWYAVAQINGKKFKRSTGTSDLQKAQQYHDGEFANLVQLLRNSPSGSHLLKDAILTEVDRVETETSTRESERVACALDAFEIWCGPGKALDQIDTKTLHQYQIHRLKTCAESTVQKDLNYILRLLKLNGFTVQRPRVIHGRFTPNRSFTDPELSKFFAACPDRWKTLFLVLLATGARPAELILSKQSTHVPLLKTEVNRETGVVLLRNAKIKPGGKRKHREIRIPPALCAKMLDEAPTDTCRKCGKKLEPKTTTSQPGKRDKTCYTCPDHPEVTLDKISDSPYVFERPGVGINHLFNKILDKAGIAKIDPLGENLTAHSFRHTYATKLHEAAGGDICVVQQALGHSDLSTTRRYDHYRGSAQIDISNLLIEKVTEEVGA